MNALRLVEDEVRELVRRRGLDPQAEPGVVRQLVDDVVADYDERALTSALPELVDAADVAREIFHAVAGFGPLQPYLDDPTVEEIWVNAPGRVFLARRGRSELTTTILDDGQVRDLVERMLKSSGRRVDLSQPFVDAMLPDGSRLHVVIPEITRRHWAVNIRKFVLSAGGLDELIALGTLTAPAARFLEAAVASGLNVIVAGGTQAGKTTLLNCLAAAIPARERVITVEEVFELSSPRLYRRSVVSPGSPLTPKWGNYPARFSLSLGVTSEGCRTGRCREQTARDCLDYLGSRRVVTEVSRETSHSFGNRGAHSFVNCDNTRFKANPDCVS